MSSPLTMFSPVLTLLSLSLTLTTMEGRFMAHNGQPSSILPSGSPIIVDLSYTQNDAVRHKLNLLNQVEATMDNLFTNTASSTIAATYKTPVDPIAKEVFNQLRGRFLDKITSLRFMLTSVERSVSERRNLELVADVFANLASRRLNESENLVNHIHKTANDLSEGIKVDLYRVVSSLEQAIAKPTDAHQGLLGLGIGSTLSGILDKLDLSALSTFTL
ncbi:hypothetical protein HDE_12571 [Halotydeus destructor]|nr:hypothetical protein HDE_12571 [Halotydeus destructor]